VSVIPRSEMSTKDENELSETARRSNLTAELGQVKSGQPAEMLVGMAIKERDGGTSAVHCACWQTRLTEAMTFDVAIRAILPRG
jgi:hypothetical protein